MMETAKSIIPPIAVEVVDELKKADLPNELRKANKKVAKEVRRTMKKAKRGRRSRAPRALVTVILLGVAAAVVYNVMKRRSQTNDVAPDAFGAAVEQERAQGAFGQRPIATPGA